MDNITIAITQQEYAEYQAMKAAKEKLTQAEKEKQDRIAYRELVDEAVNASIPELVGVSEALSNQKEEIYKRFAEVIDLKEKLFGVKDGGQWSHTFTNSESSARLRVGSHTLDNYDDTAEAGIEKVREYIAGLAGDNPKTKELVNMVMKLLQKDSRSGQLKATRVLQLEKLALESNNDVFIAGVNIIKEAYKPVPSKRYVIAEIKSEDGGWKNIPLGMTEV